MSGPSKHLSWKELSCWNRLGRQWQRFAPGELIEPYPSEWRVIRAGPLAATFEDIREMAGNAPIVVNSAYRPQPYNRAVGGVRQSQHVFGRALDIRHTALSAHELYNLIQKMLKAGELPFLGGVGLYRRFVHIDTRERTNGHVARWSGVTEGQ